MSSPLNPILVKISGVTLVSKSEHAGQFFRASLCATTRDKADEIMKLGTPIFKIRVIVAIASFVCNVESNKWPVNAALIAISIVS